MKCLFMYSWGLYSVVSEQVIWCFEYIQIELSHSFNNERREGGRAMCFLPYSLAEGLIRIVYWSCYFCAQSLALNKCSINTCYMTIFTVKYSEDDDREVTREPWKCIVPWPNRRPRQKLSLPFLTASLQENPYSMAVHMPPLSDKYGPRARFPTHQG